MVSSYLTVKLVPVEDVITGRSSRWLATQCRTGRIRGAVKIGQRWHVDLAVYAAGVREQALADLRKLSFLGT